MGHTPFDQPSSLLPNALRPGTITGNWAQAVGAANRYIAAYTADVNMKVTGDTLMFTTDANRGYFIPLYANAVCQDVYYTPGGVAVFNPAISIGFESGNAYRNFVNQQGLEPAGQIGTGQWEKGDNQGGSYFDIWGIQLEYSQYGRACPPSTGVYVRVIQASSGSIDVRTVNLFGIYTG